MRHPGTRECEEGLGGRPGARLDHTQLEMDTVQNWQMQKAKEKSLIKLWKEVKGRSQDIRRSVTDEQERWAWKHRQGEHLPTPVMCLSWSGDNSLTGTRWTRLFALHSSAELVSAATKDEFLTLSTDCWSFDNRFRGLSTSFPKHSKSAGKRWAMSEIAVSKGASERELRAFGDLISVLGCLKISALRH